MSLSLTHFRGDPAHLRKRCISPSDRGTRGRKAGSAVRRAVGTRARVLAGSRKRDTVPPRSGEWGRATAPPVTRATLLREPARRGLLEGSGDERGRRARRVATRAPGRAQ